MTVMVNGEPRDLAGATVATVVADLIPGGPGGTGGTGGPGGPGGPHRAGVAVAVNDTVVPRGEWDTTALDDGDRVEVLTAVQGG